MELFISAICGLNKGDYRMFYFDDILKKYETEYAYDKALMYLEELYIKKRDPSTLNSLIGFSWYYFVEGPFISSKYGKDEGELPLITWEKYIKIGMDNYENDYRFCFIAGYTLLLHGFFIKAYQQNYKSIGLELLKSSANTTDIHLKELVDTIINLEHSKRYVNSKVSITALNNLFSQTSLLEKYFKELFS